MAGAAKSNDVEQQDPQTLEPSKQDLNDLEAEIAEDLNEAGRRMAKEQEYALIKAYQERHDARAATALLDAHERFCKKMASRFHKGNSRIGLEDLWQEGRLGLLHAVEKFDLQKHGEVSLLTYASWWIKQYMRRYVANNATVHKRPTNINPTHQKILKSYKMLLDEYEEQTGSRSIHPNDRSAFEEKLGHRLDHIHGLFNIYYDSGISLDEPMEDGEDVTRMDYIGAEEETVTGSVNHTTTLEYIGKLIDHASLEPKEKQALVLRYLSGDSDVKTLEEVGQIMNLTRERVRQLEKIALNKIFEISAAMKADDELGVSLCGSDKIDKNAVQKKLTPKSEPVARALPGPPEMAAPKAATPKPKKEKARKSVSAAAHFSSRERQISAPAKAARCIQKPEISVEDVVLAARADCRAHNRRPTHADKKTITLPLSGIETTYGVINSRARRGLLGPYKTLADILDAYSVGTYTLDDIEAEACAHLRKTGRRLRGVVYLGHDRVRTTCTNLHSMFQHGTFPGYHSLTQFFNERGVGTLTRTRLLDAVQDYKKMRGCFPPVTAGNLVVDGRLMSVKAINHALQRGTVPDCREHKTLRKLACGNS